MVPVVLLIMASFGLLFLDVVDQVGHNHLQIFWEVLNMIPSSVGLQELDELVVESLGFSQILHGLAQQHRLDLVKFA